MAHLDELSLLVKRVEPEGTLHVTQLGTMYPGNFGLGPVAPPGDDAEPLCGVLKLGSEHSTEESQRIWTPLEVAASASGAARWWRQLSDDADFIVVVGPSVWVDQIAEPGLG